MNASRRVFLESASALAVGFGCGLAPGVSTAAVHRQAFDTRTLQDILAHVGIDNTPPGASVQIDAPDLAENPAVFPVQIASTIPDTRAVALIIDRNPFPYIARFEFSPLVASYVALRVRVAETSALRAVAFAPDGRHVSTKTVKAAAGGCAASDAPAPTYDPPAPIKMRAALAGAGAEVRALLTHPMENGLRMGPAGKPIPERFIESVLVSVNGQTAVSAELGRSVSANPLLAFRLAQAKAGDVLSITWRDTHGATRTDETRIGA
jgi:quinoprotein dehydrogenase-associated SoxYZ-like carrier